MRPPKPAPPLVPIPLDVAWIAHGALLEKANAAHLAAETAMNDHHASSDQRAALYRRELELTAACDRLRTAIAPISNAHAVAVRVWAQDALKRTA
jgi:hypothetical protein